MTVWYPFMVLICYAVFCSEANTKGSALKQHKVSLLKFFKLNEENRNGTFEILNKNESLHFPRKCGHLGKKLCHHKHKTNSSTVKKSFGPYDYDDDDDDEEGYDDYDEAPDDEEVPEETERGSYRSFDDSPPGALRDHEDDESDYDREPWQGHGFEDEGFRRHYRPGYEDDMDDWDWDSPRRHHGRHAFTSTGRERWRTHDDDYDFEPEYPSQYRHHSRHNYHHPHHYYPAHAQAHYRTFGQATPSWPTYSQGYSRGSLYPSPTQFVSNPLNTMGWPSPVTYQPRWQPQTRFNPLQTAGLNSFSTQLNTQLAGSNRLYPYKQKSFRYPQQETNSFFIPPYHVSSPSYTQVTSRNLVDFAASPHPDIAATLPQLAHHVYHYPRVVSRDPRVFSRTRHSNGPFRRQFLRHQEFPEAVLNSLRDLNLQ